MNNIMSGVKNTKVRVINEDPYGQLICDFFSKLFPKAIVPNARQLLEILTSILVGDKNIRSGPIPSPESLVAIRKTIARAIETNMPIPILVAWGGIKAGTTHGVDVAEIAALHQLIRLADSVKMYHEAGVSINIRIEDTGAYWLYRTHSKETQVAISNYSSQMEEVTEIVAEKYDIRAIKESERMDYTQYYNMSYFNSSVIRRAILLKINGHDSDSLHGLASIDWKGNLPMEQIDHYIDRYKILYPNLSIDDYIGMAADYLGGAKARYEMDGRLEPMVFEDKEHISISFVPPIPGAPASLFNKTLYYRTVPENQARTHIAPWRAKGYLEIGPDNSIKTKIISWNNHEVISKLHPVRVVFENNKMSTAVDADYLIKEGAVSPIGFVA